MSPTHSAPLLDGQAPLEHHVRLSPTRLTQQRCTNCGQILLSSVSMRGTLTCNKSGASWPAQCVVLVRARTHAFLRMLSRATSQKKQCFHSCLTITMTGTLGLETQNSSVRQMVQVSCSSIPRIPWVYHIAPCGLVYRQPLGVALVYLHLRLFLRSSQLACEVSASFFSVCEIALLLSPIRSCFFFPCSRSCCFTFFRRRLLSHLTHVLSFPLSRILSRGSVDNGFSHVLTCAPVNRLFLCMHQRRLSSLRPSWRNFSFLFSACLMSCA